MVNVKIEPQVWTKRNTGKSKRYVFSKVLVHLVITDSRGKMTADFESYLNCSLKDCDRDTPQTFLFWDHAGEERADNAGEIFDGDTPIVVRDHYCEVTVSLVSFLESRLAYLCSPDLEYCESDSECITFLNGLTVEVAVDYSTTYRAFAELFESASDHVAEGDTFLENGEYDEALLEYEEAKAIYDRVGDTVRSGIVYEKVVEVNLLIAPEYVASGEEFFEAGEYDKALQEYEKAKDIYNTVGDMKLLGMVQERIDTCKSYYVAAGNLEKGIEVFREAKHIKEDEAAIKKYQEAKLLFETAKTEFDELGDGEKSDECMTWIDQCDTELDMLNIESVSEPEKSLPFLSILGIAGGIGVVVVLVFLYKFVRAPKVPVKPEREESEEFKNLRYRLATGEISIEEYENLKSILEGLYKEIER